MNGGSRHNPVSGFIPTVQNNHSTVALDWTKVGGVVHEYVGLCKNDESAWSPRYIPNWENLPGWIHPRYKPDCSRRQEKIYPEDIRDTISSQYLKEYLQEGQETGTHRRGRRLSGRVGVGLLKKQ